MVLDRSVQSHGRPGAAPVGDFDRTLQTGASAGEGFLGDWERERDDDGTIYYYNNRTRESQWLAPEGAYELKKLPGTVGTHALVLGPGVAPAPAKEEQAAATGRPTSAPATRRPSLAATIQSGARLMGFALASFRHQKHARENRDIMQAKADEKARAKAERVMNRARREAGATIVQDKKKAWGEVTLTFLEGNKGVATVQNLVCTVKLTNAKDREDVLEQQEFPINNNREWKNESVKFDAPSPMCALRVQFYQVVPGKKKGHQIRKPYGKLQDLLPANDFVQWYDIFEDEDENGSLVEATHDLGQVKIRLSRDVLEQSRPDDDDDGKLSSGWVSKVTPEGRIFYMNLKTRQTQWNHPVMDVADLPDGWEKQVDGEGRTIYVDLKSGKPGVENSETTQYVNPAESQMAAKTRNDLVQLQHRAVRIMRQGIDVNDPTTEQDCAVDVNKQRTRIRDDTNFLNKSEFKTYKGRLWTFVRPNLVVLPDGSEIKVGGWPHGYHCLSDRPTLLALLKQEAIRCTGSARDVKFSNKLKLQGIIPVLEGFAYVRYGDGASFRWDRLYLEIRQIADGFDDEVFLTWGNLDPFNVHMTKYAVKVLGYFNLAKMTNVSCISLTSKDVEHIRSQNDALIRVKNLYGLKIESGQDDMKIAFLEERTCLQWERNLIAPQLQRLGRLSPEIMSRAGFVFSPLAPLGQFDRVLCPFCGIELHGFKQDDDVRDLHGRANPACPFVKGKHIDEDGEQVLVAGVGSADVSVARSTPFSTPYGSRASSWVTAPQSGRASSMVSSKPSHGGGGSVVRPDLARRQFLGVSTVDEQDSLQRQLDEAAAVDKTLFWQETQAVPHQKALMEHRRRMYIVMDGEHGGRLLEFAAANDLKGVTAMLDEGAPIDFADGGMRTALHWAASFGHDEVVKLLLDRGANPTDRTAMGLSPLALAEKGGFPLCAFHIKVHGGKL